MTALVNNGPNDVLVAGIATLGGNVRPTPLGERGEAGAGAPTSAALIHAVAGDPPLDGMTTSDRRK